MRKTATVTMQDEGRDKGKVFALEEMSATAAEDWALQAFFALANAKVEVPEEVINAGMAGLAQFGLKGIASISYAEAKPLFEVLMKCVKIRPDPKHPQVERSLVEDDIEEWKTRIKLRMEVFKLHVDFSEPAGVSTSTNRTPAGSASALPRTFLPRSRRSSAPGMPPT